MKLITTRDFIRTVPERWKAQYSHGGQWGPTPCGDGRVIYERLQMLNLETATHQQIAAIIGNSTWSKLVCQECGQQVEAAVEIGQASDYGGVLVCEPCVRKGTKLF